MFVNGYKQSSEQQYAGAFCRCRVKFIKVRRYDTFSYFFPMIYPRECVSGRDIVSSGFAMASGTCAQYFCFGKYLGCRGRQVLRSRLLTL